MFYSEGVSRLNYASIINAVVRAGLGYEYEPGFECPLWFTVKKDVVEIIERWCSMQYQPRYRARDTKLAVLQGLQETA